MRRIFKLKQKGFTLIELLVTISIVAIIGSTIYAPFAQARKKARDSKRVQELQEIQSSLTQYSDSHGGCYPESKIKYSFFQSLSDSPLVINDASYTLNKSYISLDLYKKIDYKIIDNSGKAILPPQSSTYPYEYMTTYSAGCNGNMKWKLSNQSVTTIGLYNSYQLFVELESYNNALSEDADSDQSPLPPEGYVSGVGSATRGLNLSDPSSELCTDTTNSKWDCIYDLSN